MTKKITHICTRKGRPIYSKKKFTYTSIKYPETVFIAQKRKKIENHPGKEEFLGKGYKMCFFFSFPFQDK